MSIPTIIGLSMVKNEDLYIRTSIKNVYEFCDKIIVLDNHSTDRTWSILNEMSTEMKKLELYQIQDTGSSHKYIEKYAGTDTWIFAFDGDELYDPLGLGTTRAKITSGTYNECFKVTGHTFHCAKLDLVNNSAFGYITPYSKTVTKLYNFGAINSWTGCENERLHGGEIGFKDGYNDDKRLHLWQTEDWESTSLRCLHLCFIQRSSLQVRCEDGDYMRQNISDKIASKKSLLELVIKYIGFALKGKIYKQAKVSGWKVEKYRSGPKVQIDISKFGITK